MIVSGSVVCFILSAARFPRKIRLLFVPGVDGVVPAAIGSGFREGLVEYLLVYRASSVQEVRVLFVRVRHQWVDTAILVQGP